MLFSKEEITKQTKDENRISNNNSNINATKRTAQRESDRRELGGISAIPMSFSLFDRTSSAIRVDALIMVVQTIRGMTDYLYAGAFLI